MAQLSAESSHALTTYADRARRHRTTGCRANRGGCKHCCETMSFVPKEEAQIVYRQVLIDALLSLGGDLDAVSPAHQLPADLLRVRPTAGPHSDIQVFAKMCVVELCCHADILAYQFFPTKLSRHCWSHLVRRFL